MIDPTAKVSEEVNRKLPTRNTMVQLLTLYTDPDRHNAQRYRRTDCAIENDGSLVIGEFVDEREVQDGYSDRQTDGRTDRLHYDANTVYQYVG